MARASINRSVWLVDTIKRYGRITRSELQEAWLRSSLSNGKPLPRRTFCNHREAAEELFGINILCDPATFEYYIEESGSESMTDWLLNSACMTDALSGAHDIADKIFVEEVPSAREHLPVVIEAIKNHTRLRFDYHPYTRSQPHKGILLEPYILKLFKQRWYVVGRNVQEKRIKTYALDRVKKATLTSQKYEDDPDFDKTNYFKDAYGIVVTQSKPRNIVLRVDAHKAKYLRALPLHPSQHESVGDGYSLFEYRMRPTEDFVAELLSHGPSITVVEPPELKAMVKESLKQMLDNYSKQ